MTYQSNLMRNRFISTPFILSRQGLPFILFLGFILILTIQQSSRTLPTVIPDGRTQWIEAGMTPDGLTPAEWESINTQLAAPSYQVTTAANGSFVAANPANQWQTTYGADGTTRLFSSKDAATSWQWGLKLNRYGYGSGQKVSTPISLVNDNQNLTYQWDTNLSEWWVNSSDGLEQGFTLLKRPQTTLTESPLILEMDVRGNLVPLVVGNTIQFQGENGETILTYDKLHVFDANGRTIPSRFAVTSHDNSNHRLRILVNDANAVYPITVDPIVQQAYLKALSIDALDGFGRSVAVSGNTLVVGANQEDSNATNVDGDASNDSLDDSGAAYVFVRSGGTWNHQAYLKASNSGLGDWFGWAVAISGDIIVVGAPFEDGSSMGINQPDNDSATFAGAAYVYSRSGTTWTFDAYLKASNTDNNDRFGHSVAVSGETIIVGAWLEDSNATMIGGNQADNSASESGAAYVFTRDSGTWSQQAYLKSTNSEGGDHFGVTVAISNDTILVGASGEDSNAMNVDGDESDNSRSNSGAAFVFNRSGSTWSQQAYLKASNTGANDFFGDALTISGDTVVVSSPYESSNSIIDPNNNDAAGSGAAYVFSRNSSTWSPQAYLKASNIGSGDNFGYSISISGDAIVVGAWHENTSIFDSGAAYLFNRNGASWTQQSLLKASNPGGGDLFGVSVSISGDTILVGARREDSNGSPIDDSLTDSGASYIFRESFCSNQSGNWNSTATWVGGVVPGSANAACISIGDTVTLNAAAAVNSLTVYPDAALDLSTFGFTAENSVTNHGTLSQTRTVNSNAVNFLEIQNIGANSIKYRGVSIDASDNSQNLGSVEVAVRETVNWYTRLDEEGDNYIRYCTSHEELSPTYAQRCFSIEPSIQPVSNVTVRLWGLSSELNGIPQAELAVFRHVGGAGSTTWLELLINPGNGDDAGSYSYAEGDTPGFSSFLLGDSGNSPTAVSFLSSTITQKESFIFLIALILLLGLTSTIVWYTRTKSV